MFNSMDFQPVGYAPSASVIPNEWSLSYSKLVCLCLFLTAPTVLVLKCDWLLYCREKQGWQPVRNKQQSWPNASSRLNANIQTKKFSVTGKEKSFIATKSRI